MQETPDEVAYVMGLVGVSPKPLHAFLRVGGSLDEAIVAIEEARAKLRMMLAVQPPTDEARPSQPDLEQEFRRVAGVIGDDNAIAILAIAQQQEQSAEERMQKILNLDSRFAGKNSNEWATILGVTPAAVRGYDLWKRLQESKKADR